LRNHFGVNASVETLQEGEEREERRERGEREGERWGGGGREWGERKKR
jgi:hypothetical protein